MADRVYRLGTDWANFYLVAGDGDELAPVDAGYPGYFGQLKAALDALGSSPADIRSVVVTHHHVDHVGTAEAVRSSGSATVVVHESDAAMVRGESRSHVPPGFYRQSWRPSMIRYLAHTVAASGARYRPASVVEALRGDELLDLPGRPRVIHTPGHTSGHCSVVLEERGVLFTGDALVNFDYATGARALGLHRFNDDRERALSSLHRLELLDAEVVLFGHGEPWADGLQRALELVTANA